MKRFLPMVAAALRRSLWMLRALGLVALMLPARSAIKADSASMLASLNRFTKAALRRSAAGLALFVAAGTALGQTSTGDPYFGLVTLLMHANGVNGSTSLTDTSGSAHVIAANGSAQVSTAESAFGGASVKFNGSTAYLSTPDSADFDLGSGDFTIEMFVRPASVSAVYSLISQWPTAGNLGFTLYQSGANLEFWYTTDGSTNINAITAAHGLLVNQWAHIAVARSGSNLRIFVNGAQIGSTYSIGSASIFNSSGALQLGRNPAGDPYAYPYNGYMDEIRLTKGVARYTSNFVAPSSPFPDGVNDCPAPSVPVGSGCVAPATTALSSSLNPSSYTAAVTLTATVSSTNAPTGTVTFKDGSSTLGTATLSAGQATFTSSALAVGSHSLTAVYAGDTNNPGSTSPTLVQQVNPVTTSVILSAAPNQASVGQNVTLLAKISGGALPSGNITFSDGGTTLGSANVVGGTASFSTAGLALGSHSLGASYAGDANNQAASAAPVTLTVAQRSAMTWQYGYDAMGRPNTVVDPNGLTTYTYYDSLGRPIQTQQPPNTGSATPTITQLGYNLGDGLTSVADPRNLATSYSPNGLGNVTAESSPDRGATSYTHDAKGNLLTRTDARGKTTSYTYDNLDRLKTISYPSGSGTAFEYDGGATPTAAEAGELTKMTDESGQTTYTHDALGRLTTKTVTIGAKTFTVGYTWGDSGSALDKLTAITYPSGSRINYSYDASGALSAISVNPVNANGSGTSGSSQPLLGSIGYNVERNPSGWQWSDGKARLIGYDSYGQVSSYSLGDPLGSGNAAGVLRSVSRDAAGRISGYSHTNNGQAQATLDQSFGYDNLNRLTAATVAGVSTAYSYDETGNRTAKTIGGTTYTNTVSATSNRLTQTQDATGTANVQYDAAGHITADGTNTYSYNDRGRMSGATTPGGNLSFLYNGLEQRAAKTASSGSSYYVYDEAGQLLGEYDQDGSPLYETIYLQGLPVGVLKQTGSAANSDIAVTIYNLHADHIATPRVITKQDHTIVWRWDTAEAFGATAPDQNPTGQGAFSYNPRFPGQVFDAETGLNQNWNREYNARTGRYIQSDPIGLRGGINTFSYALGDPLRYTDPKGLVVPAAVMACLANPVCAAAMAAAAAATAKACIDTYNALDNLVFNRPKNPPDIGPPNGWIQGPRRGRQYGPDGRPDLDIDKGHQGNEQDHAHQWPDGKREEPGWPVSPWPRQ